MDLVMRHVSIFIVFVVSQSIFSLVLHVECNISGHTSRVSVHRVILRKNNSSTLR